MISFCLIIKNEEKWLQACLKSIEPLASEIIIADTGSNDRSIEIAKQFAKVKLFEIPWESHFGNARNATIERATQPWIFSFDADESIALQDHETFKKQIHLADQDLDCEALSLVRRDYVTNPAISGFVPCRGEYPHEENQHPGFYTERMIRIFRNRPHIRWVGSLHEMVDKTLKGTILNSSLIFHHYGYMPEEVAAKKKREFYEQAGHKKTAENPQDWKAHYDVGIEYLGAGEFANAIVFLQKALQLKGPVEIVQSNLGFALMSMNRLTEAERVLRECVEKFPNHHDGRLNLGVVLMRRSEFKDALKNFAELTVQHPQSFLAHRNMGICFAQLGDLVRAEQQARRALEMFPAYTEAELDMAVYALQQRRMAEGLQYLQSALRREPQNSRAQQMKAALNV